MVKQLSVFIENKPGRLMEVLQALAEKNIDIKEEFEVEHNKKILI